MWHDFCSEILWKIQPTLNNQVFSWNYLKTNLWRSSTCQSCCWILYVHYMIKFLSDLLLYLFYRWGNCLNKVKEPPEVSLASNCHSQDLNSSLPDFPAIFWVLRRETWAESSKRRVSGEALKGRDCSPWRKEYGGEENKCFCGRVSPFPIIMSGRVEAGGNTEDLQTPEQVRNSESNALGKFLWQPWVAYIAVEGEWGRKNS